MTWKLTGYVVEELLGFGGSGEVWRGRVSSGGDPVALKRLSIAEPAQLQGARAEAALLSTLDHPHLIRLHELVPVADAVVLVLDLAAGGSLADLLAQRGRLPAGEVITALAPIGAALAYAHNEGVVHGDVTPANVLFTEPGLPLLADLGVARIVGDSAPARSTPAYVDPAVAAGCAPGAPSDVFMLAATAVHALTGMPVWSGASPAEMLAQAAAGELDVADRLSGIPFDMAALLVRALSVEPHLRCTAAELALDLRHSGEPVPVELAAGRVGGRGAPAESVHAPAAEPGAVAELGPGPEPGAGRRPVFPRPGIDAPLSHPGQLTHGVRAALRPVLPTRRRRVREVLRRVVRYAGPVLAVVGIGATAAFALSAHRSDPAPPDKSAAPQAKTVSPQAKTVSPQAKTVSPQADAPPARPNGPSTLDAASAAALLRSFDKLREQAFARRDPGLLSRVYLPGPLLVQDTALLERIVPRGCTLAGVRTEYTSVRVVASGDRPVVTARATLAPSTLICGATRSGAAAGEGPTTLRIELVRREDGFRIAGQRPADH